MPNSSEEKSVSLPTTRAAAWSTETPALALALVFLDQRSAGQVQVGAVLVAVEPLALAGMGQAGDDHQVVLGEVQRLEDRGQLAERSRLLRLPRLQHRAAGDGEDAHANRRLGRRRVRAGSIASRNGRASMAPAPRRRERREIWGVMAGPWAWPLAANSIVAPIAERIALDDLPHQGGKAMIVLFQALGGVADSAFIGIL